MAVTHIKLQGVLSLGLGLHGQSIALSLILRTISRAICATSNAELVEDHRSIFPEESFQSFSCAFLDPIASDDLIILWRCRNYSVIGIALAAIRNLTVGTMREYPDLWSLLLRNMENDAPFKYDGFSPKILFENFYCDDSKVRDQIINNLNLINEHLCASTYTTLGVAGGFREFKSISNEVSGLVALRTIADVSPGHEVDSAEFMQSQLSSLNKSPKELSSSSHRCILTGRHDYEKDIPGSDKTLGLISTADMLCGLSLLWSSVDSPSSHAFLDVNTHVLVPVPLIQDNNPAVGYEQLAKLLKPSTNDNSLGSNQRLSLCSRVLQKEFALDQPWLFYAAMRRMRIPESARDVIMRLFNEFVTAVADPLYFENVLDLDDAFRFLFELISDYPTSLANEPEFRRQQLFMSARDYIFKYTEALRSAFLMRIGRTSPKIEAPYGDVRGSVTNIISAGEAAVKCGVGFLRKQCDGVSTPSKPHICGILAAHFSQRATIRSARLSRFRGAIVSVDASQLFELSHLSKVLHEIAHLYFELNVCDDLEALSDAILTTNVNLPPSVALDPSVLEMVYVHASESFVELFLLLNLYNKDVKTFLTYNFLVYKTVCGEAAVDETVSLGEWKVVSDTIEVFYRMFLVSKLVRVFEEKEIKVDWDVDQFCEEFVEFILEWEAFIPEWIGIPIEKFTDASYVVAQANSKWLPLIDQLVLSSVVSATEKLCSIAGNSFASASILVDQAVSTGTPIPLLDSEFKVDELAVVFRSVYVFIRETCHDCEVSNFDPVDGCFLDKAHATAERRFSMFAVLSKSLWHISCRQRSRRLIKLLQQSK